MGAQRHITVTVGYDRRLRYGPSLQWIARDLQDAGLTEIEDHAEWGMSSRTWAGTVDGPTYETLVRVWRLREVPAVCIAEGDASLRVYTFDGMNWEIDGESPVTYVRLQVREDGVRGHEDATPLLARL